MVWMTARMPETGGRGCFKVGFVSGRTKSSAGVEGGAIVFESGARSNSISTLSGHGWWLHEWHSQGSAANVHSSMASWCSAAWLHGNTAANSATTTNMCFNSLIS